jgi:hypothetical protein
MAKDFQQLLSKILVAIKKQEIRQRKQKMIGFLVLSLVIAFTIPFTSQILISQINNSGITYFLEAIMNDFQSFLNFWQEFTLAILESLPIIAILVFAISLEAFIFTFRLFLREKTFIFKI